MTIRYLGDLEPDIEIVLSGSTPVNLVAATSVTVVASVDDWASELWSRTPSTVTTDGDVTRLVVPLQAGDTDTVQRVELKVVVDWPGDRPQSFFGAVLDVRKDADGLRL